MAGESIMGPVPSGWEVTTLGEIVERGGGHVQTGPFGSQLHASDYVPVGVPSIMPVNLGDNRIIEEGIARITEEDAERLSRHRVQAGDIIYSRRGDVKRRALIRPGQEGWLCGTGCLKIHLGDEGADPRFVSYYLGHPEVRAWLLRHSVGATMPNLNTSVMKAIPLLVPSPKEQQAIACILSALDDKIELNRRMNQTLEGMAQAIFKSWFVDFDPVRAKCRSEPLCSPPGLASHIADLFPDALDASEVGEIPKGWTHTSLKRLFPLDSNCVITGPFGSNLHASDYREEGVPLLLVKNVVKGAIIEDGVPLVGWHKVPELERYRLKLGDIIFTRVGAVGRSAYINPRYVGWMISGQTLRVSISDWDILHPRYLASVFQYPTFIAMVESHALGTTRPSLNTRILESFAFLYPSPALQFEYARIVMALDERRSANLDQIGTLATLRDTLLPKLISGELRVPDAERFCVEAGL
jgi:type I restriction enzyme S subunit